MKGSLFLLLIIFTTAAFASTQRDYKQHQKVPVLVNNVGPFHNPAETYKYYSLPFCPPKNTDNVDENLGEILAGDTRQPSLYDVRFKVDVQWAPVCHFTLSQDVIKRFIDSIKQQYIFEMFVDDLPIKGFVGETEEFSEIHGQHFHNETHYFLFTHLDFSIAYHQNNVISVNLTTDPAQRVELVYGKDIQVEFSYSAHWIEVDTPWIDRMSLHSRSLIGDQSIEIHWLSIINSFVLVILLTAFLAVILIRILKKDVARYMELEGEDEMEDPQDEVGWKLVHGDVFRYPRYIIVLSSATGVGIQLLVLVISLLFLALIGTFYPGNRGALYSAAVVLYALTAGISGYVSTRLYYQLGGTKWATNAVITTCMFSFPFFVVFSVINTIAWYYGSSTCMPPSTVAMICLLWALVTFPLTIFGSNRGRNKNNNFDAPCKTNRVEREIPVAPWYRHPILQFIISGFLPFSAIYVELHYIFAAVWGHRVYTLFGILTLTFLMLVLVTAFITVALTYFQLAAEDYNWWWRSFFSGASTGVFVYIYAIFFYMYRSEMTGFLQAAFFFGYMAVISFGFSLMLGSISFLTALSFVRYIYGSIKID